MSPPSSANTSRGLSWPKLVPATLLKRYKRFLADVKLESGETVTVHCPNTGSMAGCCEPGRTVYLSVHNNPGRKYPYTWESNYITISPVSLNDVRPPGLTTA